MNTLQRYISRKIVAALFMALAALSLTIWMSQALQQFNLVTAGGQAFLTFLHLTLLSLPFLLGVIVPVSVMIAVIYTLTTLNNGSELTIINAAGARPSVVLRPILLLGGIVTGAMMTVSLLLTPATQLRMRDLLTLVNTDILTSVIRDGQFIQVAQGLTVHVNRRNPDRSLEGIFVADGREADQIVTYIAKRGAIAAGPSGSFLIMQEGLIQRQNRVENSISMIEFRTYAFDLSSFTAGSAVASYPPSARSTAYLLSPDPDDPVFQKTPDRFRVELHDRLTSPFYVLVFALLPLAFLGEARTARQGRFLAISGTVLLLSVLRQFGYVLPSLAAATPELIPLFYLLPGGLIALSLAMISGVIRPRLPRSLARALEATGRRLGGMFWRPRAAAGEQRRP